MPGLRGDVCGSGQRRGHLGRKRICAANAAVGFKHDTPALPGVVARMAVHLWKWGVFEDATQTINERNNRLKQWYNEIEERMSYEK
jgi:hypothetical protein